MSSGERVSPDGRRGGCAVEGGVAGAVGGADGGAVAASPGTRFARGVLRGRSFSNRLSGRSGGCALAGVKLASRSDRVASKIGRSPLGATVAMAGAAGD